MDALDDYIPQQAMGDRLAEIKKFWKPMIDDPFKYGFPLAQIVMVIDLIHTAEQQNQKDGDGN